MYEFHGTRAMYYGFWNVLYNVAAYGMSHINLISAFDSLGDTKCSSKMSGVFYTIDQCICLGFWVLMSIEIFLWFKKEKGTS
jgi:hypothetical protein